MRWIPDPMPSPPRRAEQEFPVPLSDSIAPIPSDSVHSHDIRVCVRKTSDTQASANTTSVPSGAPLTPSLPKNAGEGDRLAEQPIKIGYPVQLPQ